MIKIKVEGISHVYWKKKRAWILKRIQLIYPDTGDKMAAFINVVKCYIKQNFNNGK